MKCWIYSLLLVTVVTSITSCASPVLTRRPPEVASHVPIGTPSADAIQRMKKFGFECENIVNGTILLQNLIEGHSEQEEISGVNFVECTQKTSAPLSLVTAFETIYLELDDKDQVCRVHKRMDFTGP